MHITADEITRIVKRNSQLFLAAYQWGKEAARKDQALERQSRRRLFLEDLAVVAGAKQLSGLIDQAELEAEMLKRTGTTVWKAQPRPAARPLTEQQKRDAELAWRAGIC